MSQARLGCGSALCIGLDSGANLSGDWDGAKTACFRIALDAHRRDRARGNADLLAVLGFKKLKFERDRPGPEPAHPARGFRQCPRNAAGAGIRTPP